MDVLTSSEFRKRYGKLLRPTIVTANGHPIGVWQPHKGPAEAEWREALGVEPVPSTIERGFAEFRPAPKPGHRK